MKMEPHDEDFDAERKSRGRRREGASFPVPTGRDDLPADYAGVLEDIKGRVRLERLRITLVANAAMILLYWDIGQIILDRQKNEGWGAKGIDDLSHDLKLAFPDMTDFSPRNLKYMRTFSRSWPDREFVQHTIAQIPWRSNNCLARQVEGSGSAYMVCAESHRAWSKYNSVGKHSGSR